MTNLARFLIDASPSNDRGFDVNPGDTPSLRLEASSSLVSRVTFEVHSAAAGAPRSTTGAPTLTLTGASTGQSVDAATPSSTVEVTAGIPGSRAAHLWEIRCKVNGGTNSDGSVNPDWVFSRFMAMRSPLGLRKIMMAERDEYDPVTSWAGALNEFLDATTDTGGVSVTHDPGTGYVTTGGVEIFRESTGILITPTTPGEATIKIDPAARITNTGNGRRIDRAYNGIISQNMTADFGETVGSNYLHGYRRIVATDLVGADRIIALGTDGCILGDTIEITNNDAANKLIVTGDGSASLPPGWGATGFYLYNGSTWKRTRVWVRERRFTAATRSTSTSIALYDATATFNRCNALLLTLGASITVTLRNGGAIAGDIVEIGVVYNASGYTATLVNEDGDTLQLTVPSVTYQVSASRYMFDGTKWRNWTQGV